ncbi:UNVERIFIED_CONTAM: RNA-binding protein 2 [Sesamum radiatum]|uniref:RNA-binding protein 2 n=1 Tax=Sesamum radiatum TaxID=300843 RepID=A0AAW2TGW5_SESRA
MSNYRGDYQGQGRPYRDMIPQMPTDGFMSGYHAHHDGRGHSVHMQHGSGYYSRENYWDRNDARAPYDHYLPSRSSFAPTRTGGGRPHIPLPPNACSTLYVEGLPADSTRREVAHIFRPFLGYMGLRLVSREPRQPGGQPIILCFVDFLTSGHAARAMDVLQGYQVDLDDSQSGYLRLEFSRFPEGRRPGKRLPLKSESVEEERNQEALNFFAPFNYAFRVSQIRNQNINKSGLNLTAGSALHDGHGMRFSYASITGNRSVKNDWDSASYIEEGQSVSSYLRETRQSVVRLHFYCLSYGYAFFEFLL